MASANEDASPDELPYGLTSDITTRHCDLPAPHTHISATCTTTFHVHSSLLCAYSDVFNRELNGLMREAKERKMEFGEEWGLERVERVVEFLFTGSYRGWMPVWVEEAGKEWVEEVAVEQEGPARYSYYGEPEPEPVPSPPLPPLFLLPTATLPPTKQCNISPPLTDSDHHHPSFLVSTQRTATIPSNFDTKKYSFSKPLLGHACVYAFAEMYNIRALKAVAYEEVRGVLGCFEGGVPQHFINNDLIVLIQYVYENTPGSGPGGGKGDSGPSSQPPLKAKAAPPEEPLRALLSTFAAWNIKSLTGEEWEDFISEGGDFSRDLWRRVGVRMRAGQYVDEAELVDGGVRGRKVPVPFMSY